MFEINFEKVYARPLENEPYFLAFPLKRGELSDISRIYVETENGVSMPVQAKTTAYWDDGSIKWIFMRSVADLPANTNVRYYCGTEERPCESRRSIANEDGRHIDTGALSAVLSVEENKIFDSLEYGGKEISVSAPKLFIPDGECKFKINKWQTAENGPLCAVIEGFGSFSRDSFATDAKITLTFFADKPWFELAVSVINTTDGDIDMNRLVIDFDIRAERYFNAISNYGTRYTEGKNGESVYTEISADFLQYESNEHNPEVFYGTFFGECANSETGICASVFQAQQNFPKAIETGPEGMCVMLVPEDHTVTLKSGMARQQKILVVPHGPETSRDELNHRTTVYQMPVRPQIKPEIFERAGVFENVFAKNKISKYEIFMTSKADEHGRAYGMLHWGDFPDGGYTAQGRGGGRLVWTNNEYDFPHAAALMYARTGVRRYFDYSLVAARHQIDVDICHYSKDPLIFEGQYEHCAGHIDAKKVACSHQWVEGLLDCWHFTGDREYLDAALGIGRNVQRLLEQPVFQKSGQANARETGWALRTLSALYKETNDPAWLEKCDWIVGHFHEWEEEYGLWLAPYTDNTAVRVVFMISIAVCSLMRYYKIKPKQSTKEMMLRAVDDLIENARLDNGLFYYKELPSLKRLGNNPIILEALTYAYELTGNADYLKAGLPTFEFVQGNVASMVSGMYKRNEDDALLNGHAGTKGFAQMMVPFCTYYTAAEKEGLL